MKITKEKLRKLIREVLSDEERKAGEKKLLDVSVDLRGLKSLHRSTFKLPYDINFELSKNENSGMFIISITCASSFKEMIKSRPGKAGVLNKVKSYAEDFLELYYELNLLNVRPGSNVDLSRSGKEDEDVIFFTENKAKGILIYQTGSVVNCKKLFMYMYLRLKRDFELED